MDVVNGSLFPCVQNLGNAKYFEISKVALWALGQRQIDFRQPAKNRAALEWRLNPAFYFQLKSFIFQVRKSKHFGFQQQIHA